MEAGTALSRSLSTFRDSEITVKLRSIRLREREKRERGIEGRRERKRERKRDYLRKELLDKPNHGTMVDDAQSLRGITNATTG